MSEDKKLDSFVDSLFRLELSEQTLPEVKVVKNKEWIDYKTKNYYQYLCDLAIRDAEHGAILSGKLDFVYGKGLAYDNIGDEKKDSKVMSFLSRANRTETVNDIQYKVISDLENFNGYAIQYIYGRNGSIVDSYHINLNLLRPSVDGKGYYYCEDWYCHSPKSHPSFKFYPKYSKNIKIGSCIFFYVAKMPTANKYASMLPIPLYSGALSAIETDINIDTFHFTNSDSGMTAALLLSFFNGANATDEQKRKLKELFTKNHTGPNRAGSVIFNFCDPNAKGVEATQLSPKDLDKQFEILGKRVMQKKFSAHQVDPILFGIDTTTSWSRNNILEKWEKFKKTYIDLRRPHSMEWLHPVAESNKVDITDVYYEDNAPIGDEITLTEGTFKEILTTDELRHHAKNKLGIELIEDTDKMTRLNLAQKLGAGNLAEMLRVIEGTLPDERKLSTLIKVFGVKEAVARQILGLELPIVPVAMSKPSVIDLFKARARKSNNDEILEEVHVSFDSTGKAVAFEESKYFEFADVVSATVTELRNSILDLLASGDVKITPELIAKQLGVEVEIVNEQISVMKEANLLKALGKGFAVTDKGMNRAENVDPVVETEIYTVYQYALSPQSDYKNSKGYKDTSHEFCIDMMKLSNDGNEWTREDIDALSNDLGDNAWIYRGGFTGRKGGGVTSYCNHVWKAITKKRIKK